MTGDRETADLNPVSGRCGLSLDKTVYSSLPRPSEGDVKWRSGVQ